jgi:hypothetical protein
LNTLSDVIVKLHYTAREGGALLKEKVMETVVKAMPKEGLSRFFSAKHEFPDEWYRFLYVPESGVGHSLGLDLMLERFPFLYQGKEIELNSWEIFVKLKSGMEYQGGDPLFLDLIQEGQSQFKDNELTLDPVLQLPYTKPFGDQNAESIGPWIIRATEVMIPSLHPDLKRKVTVNGQDLFQLNPEAFEDLWVVCHYSVLNPV